MNNIESFEIASVSRIGIKKTLGSFERKINFGGKNLYIISTEEIQLVLNFRNHFRLNFRPTVTLSKV